MASNATGSNTTPFFGCKISLISKSEIRYEGILYTIDPKESTIALAKVRSFGSEDRPVERPVPPRDDIFEFIIFRASDIKDLIVDDPPPAPAPTLTDPAIIQAQHSGSTSFPSSFPQPSNGTAALPTGPAPIAAAAAVAAASQAAAQQPSPATKDKAKSSDQGQQPGGNAASQRQSDGQQQSKNGAGPRQPRQNNPNAASQRQSDGQQQSKNGDGPRQPRQNNPNYRNALTFGGGFVNRQQQQQQGGFVNRQPQQQQQQQGGFVNRQPQQQQQGGFRSFNNSRYNNNNFQNRQQDGSHQQMGAYRGGQGGYRGRGGFGGYNNNRNFVPNHRGPMSHHANAPKFPPLPDGDFDFDKAQADFKILEEKLSALKLNGTVSSTEGGDGESGAAAELPEIPGIPASAIAVAALEQEEVPSEPCYNKTKSFFDSISCEALEREKGSNQRVDWKAERKLNRETFGVVSARRPTFYRTNNRGGFGGRGGHYYRGSGNYHHQNQHHQQQAHHQQNTSGAAIAASQ